MSENIDEKRVDAIAKARAMIALDPNKVAEQMCDLVRENVEMLQKIEDLRKQLPSPMVGTLNSADLTKKILEDLHILYPGLGFLLVVAPQNHPEKGAYRSSWNAKVIQNITAAISTKAKIDSKDSIIINWPKGPKS
jgi:hypothetical protein